MHIMNDARQDPMDVVLALVQKCKQGRDAALIHDYLGSQKGRPAPQSAPLNQVLNAHAAVSYW